MPSLAPDSEQKTRVKRICAYCLHYQLIMRDDVFGPAWCGWFLKSFPNQKKTGPDWTPPGKRTCNEWRCRNDSLQWLDGKPLLEVSENPIDKILRRIA